RAVVEGIANQDGDLGVGRVGAQPAFNLGILARTRVTVAPGTTRQFHETHLSRQIRRCLPPTLLGGATTGETGIRIGNRWLLQIGTLPGTLPVQMDKKLEGSRPFFKG